MFKLHFKNGTTVSYVFIEEIDKEEMSATLIITSRAKSVKRCLKLDTIAALEDMDTGEEIELI